MSKYNRSVQLIRFAHAQQLANARAIPTLPLQTSTSESRVLSVRSPCELNGEGRDSSVSNARVIPLFHSICYYMLTCLELLRAEFFSFANSLLNGRKKLTNSNSVSRWNSRGWAPVEAALPKRSRWNTNCTFD